MPAWTENKTISLQHRSYNNASHTMGAFYSSYYWDGSQNQTQFNQPHLKITAFK